MFKQALFISLIFVVVQLIQVFAVLFPPISPSDSVAIDMSPSVSKNTFHQITASDTVAPTMSTLSIPNSFHQALAADTWAISLSSLFIPNSFHQALAADTWAISLSSPTFVGNGTITIQTKSSLLVPSATYSISPNPLTGSGTLTIADGGPGDLDGVNNGIVKVANVPTGTFNITQTVTPVGFTSLLKSSIATVAPTQMDPIIIFQVVSSTTNLSQLPATSITAPALTATTLNTWTSSFSPTLVTSTTSSSINNVNQLSDIITAGQLNTTAINQALASQSSVLLNTSFPPLTSGTTVINTFGVSSYTLPSSPSLVAVIPTIVTTVNPTSGQTIATPPLDKIIPGQEMIIPVTDSLIPSFGGLKQLNLTSSPTVTSSGGTAPSEWFVAEVDNKIPSSITTAGIQGTLDLFLNIQYPFEDTGVGINWANPANFADPPRITLEINKTSLSSIQQDSVGCPVINAYTLSSGSWTTSGLSEISSKSISSSKCTVTIQPQHLSKFAFSLSHISSISTSTGLAGSGAVSAGLGNSGGQVASAQPSNGVVASVSTQGFASKVSQVNATVEEAAKLKIYDVTYDVCTKKVARIVVGSFGNDTTRVLIRTSLQNETFAQLSQNQTWTGPDSDPKMNTFVFETPLDANYKSFEILVLAKSGNNVDSIESTIQIASCNGDTLGNNLISFYNQYSNPSVFVKTFQLLKPITLDWIRDASGKPVTNPSVIYSSFKYIPNTQYHVISPDGTCVIGSLENCIVHQSTYRFDGKVENVTLNGQVYTIRFSGSDSPLERFSVSSQNPIVGQWKVMVSSKDGTALRTDIMQDASLTVRYSLTS